MQYYSDTLFSRTVCGLGRSQRGRSGSAAQLLLHPVGALAAAHSASPSTNAFIQLRVPCLRAKRVLFCFVLMLSAMLVMSHYFKNHAMQIILPAKAVGCSIVHQIVCSKY